MIKLFQRTYIVRFRQFKKKMSDKSVDIHWKFEKCILKNVFQFNFENDNVDLFLYK